MTDKELKKLKRRELLEILYYMRKELDETRLENERLKKFNDENCKNHEEIMTALDKVLNKINKLCGKQLDDTAKQSDVSQKVIKPHNKRKQKRGAEKGGK